MQQGPVSVHRRRPVPGEQLEREQCGAASGRALVLDAPAEELELLAVAELADRAVGDGPLAEIGAACGRLDLFVPLRT
ncbi:MAG TPA: hypothetical protein VE440_06015 [Gaiellaceae bacterium]|nr:hypothetical protein [Gaiellaceae bacterium]